MNNGKKFATVLIIILFSTPTFIMMHQRAEAAGVNANYITFPDTYLSNTAAWGIRWGDVGSTLSITDVPGLGVRFDLGAVINKMGVGDVYPVVAPGVGDNWTGFGGYELYIKNTGTTGFNAHLYMNTGFTSGGAQPAYDTFWGGSWAWLNSGEVKLFSLNFTYAEAWNAEDDPEVTWRVPGGTWTDVKRLNEVTNVGFEVVGNGNFSLIVTGSCAPELYVDPSNVTKNPSDNGTTFTVDIVISNFTEFYAFDIEITWNSSLLKYESVAYTNRLDNLWGAGNWNPILEKSTAGSFGLVATKFGLGGNSSVDAYVLFSITLRVVKFGTIPLETSIHFNIIKLSDSATPTPNHIVPTSVADGTYIMNPAAAPDLAVTGANVPKAIVCKGFGINITCTVFNNGDSTETFNLTLYANESMVERETVNLMGGGFAAITFVWNTTGFSKGFYGIWAYAEPVSGEIVLANNNFTDGNVLVTGPGDIAPEFGIVDIFDVVVCSTAFGSTPSSYNWNPVADISNDGLVDIFDIVVVAVNFG